MPTKNIQEKQNISPDNNKSDSLYFKRNHNNEIAFLGKDSNIFRDRVFKIDFTSTNNIINIINDIFNVNTIADYMDLDNLIKLLKKVGLKDKTLTIVRQEINEGKLKSIVVQPDDFEADAHLRSERVAVGQHSERILTERGTPEELGNRSGSLPKTFEEAKALVPGLRKWVDIKREAGLTGHREGFDQQVYDLMLRHLRDQESGLGKWATAPDGLLRSVLRKIDSGALQELYSLGNPDLPSDINLPRGKPTGRPHGSPDQEKRAFAPRPNRQLQVEVPSLDEVRAARRIVRRAERAAERKS